MNVWYEVQVKNININIWLPYFSDHNKCQSHPFLISSLKSSLIALKLKSLHIGYFSSSWPLVLTVAAEFYNRNVP